ncbi:MAG: hypothetical protein CBC13_08715 [Planctomycetia bacterium TMED53]|nr:MAG: hypothetical protein CBC13_08715 [Planctomycetia bacterium TMED53]
MEVTVLLFAKLPVPGAVKTRLASSVGPAAAARLAAAMLVDRLAMISSHFSGEEATRVLCGDQRTSDPFCPYLDLASQALTNRDCKKKFHPHAHATGWDYRNQGEGALGERLFRWIEHFQGRNLLILGTDAMSQGSKLFFTVVKSLAAGEAVMEPAEDGGFNLLALPAEDPARGLDPLREALTGGNLPWEKVAKAVKECRWRLRLLPPAPDIDTIADLNSMLRRWNSSPNERGNSLHICHEVAKLPKDVWRDGTEMPILKARKPVPGAVPDKE